MVLLCSASLREGYEMLWLPDLGISPMGSLSDRLEFLETHFGTLLYLRTRQQH